MERLHGRSFVSSLRTVFTAWKRGVMTKGFFHGRFRSDLALFRRLSQNVRRFPIPSWKDCYPCAGEKTAQTDFDHHYTYHLAWAARTLARIKPEAHVDISSSLYFSTIVSAFLPVTFYDYRPAPLELDNLRCGFADLLSLPFDSGSIPSLSCMHVVEHLGLGRYGDPIDPSADVKAIDELKRVMAPQGFLLYVVPIGAPRIEFNAHRIYSYRQVIDLFADLELVEFALIPDFNDGTHLVPNASEELADLQHYGCGCFLFCKTSHFADVTAPAPPT